MNMTNLGHRGAESRLDTNLAVTYPVANSSWKRLFRLIVPGPKHQHIKPEQEIDGTLGGNY